MIEYLLERIHIILGEHFVSPLLHLLEEYVLGLAELLLFLFAGEHCFLLLELYLISKPLFDFFLLINLLHFPLLVFFHLNELEITGLQCKPSAPFNSVLELGVVFLGFCLHLIQKTVVVIGSTVVVVQIELLLDYV